MKSELIEDHRALATEAARRGDELLPVHFVNYGRILDQGSPLSEPLSFFLQSVLAWSSSFSGQVINTKKKQQTYLEHSPLRSCQFLWFRNIIFPLRKIIDIALFAGKKIYLFKINIWLKFIKIAADTEPHLWGLASIVRNRSGMLWEWGWPRPGGGELQSGGHYALSLLTQSVLISLLQGAVQPHCPPPHPPPPMFRDSLSGVSHIKCYCSSCEGELSQEQTMSLWWDHC